MSELCRPVNNANDCQQLASLASWRLVFNPSARSILAADLHLPCTLSPSCEPNRVELCHIKGGPLEPETHGIHLALLILHAEA